MDDLCALFLMELPTT